MTVGKRNRALAALALALAAGPVSAQVSSADTTSRLIVKFRDSATLHSQAAANARFARVTDDAASAGVALTYHRAMAAGAHVMALDRPLTIAAANAIAARLAQNPDVEYAVPDIRRHAYRTTNDPYLSSQPYLGGVVGGINAFSAWDVTTGSPNVVVAIVDTGYLPHPDLAGRILPGYDFIGNPKIANDGDGRDADATDPGDWVSQADLSDPAFSGQQCKVEDSSWHGTSVTGIIAANSNNSQWLAGIDWAAKILPVRALGKCGGDDSDIMDAIAWAAGLPVPGVPANPYPAQIINLSLGGSGTCTAAYHSVLGAVLAHGVTRAIIAAAGNDAIDVASSAPASCSEVIAVAATTNQGSLASYSDFGAGIALSAPGGDVPPNFDTDNIAVLFNSGKTVPELYGYGIGAGTSFSAPIVAGVASLVLGLAPNLSAAQLRSLLTSTASAFPVASNCSTSRCGAGIVNARAAVAAAVGTGLDLNQHGLTGSYYEPATNGQGFEVEIYPDQQGPGAGGVFMSWFTFDTVAGGADRQRWYTLGGQALSGQPSASLTIYRNTGGNFNAPPITNGVAVGTATLSFDTCASGRLSYAFTDGSGRTGTIPLTRITQNVTCSTTGARPTNADFALSGNWYDPATNGQGFSVEVNPNNRTVFIPWYTYAPAGAGAGVAGQRWYTAQGPYTPGSRSIAVDLYETTGGVFDAPTPASNSAKVGSGTLAFQSCSHATMNFNFFAGSSSGSSGTIVLIRPGPVPPGCVF